MPTQSTDDTDETDHTDETHRASADRAAADTASTDTPPTETNWQVSYDDVDPIRIRDPVAEALCVLDPGDPFVVDYADVVMVAGHSCPTAAGAYRLTQLALDALYPAADSAASDVGDTGELPVRGDIEVLAGGPRDDSTYGVMSRLVSTITGAAQEDGFGGLAGGHGARRDMLHFQDLDRVEPTFQFRRTDTGATVEVTYHVSAVPSAGPATSHLPELVDGTATQADRDEFASAWHARVGTVLSDDDLFTVDPIEWALD